VVCSVYIGIERLTDATIDVLNTIGLASVGAVGATLFHSLAEVVWKDDCIVRVLFMSNERGAVF
jgi:hypothetical protein